VGYAAATANKRAAGHQHPQHVIAALARLAQAGEPMLGPCEQFCRDGEPWRQRNGMDALMK